MQSLKASKLSLPAQAQHYLLDLIKQGTFQPGQPLPSEPDLAAQMGISRSTLREALHGLERQGVLLRKHGVGTFVSPAYGRQLESGLEQLVSTIELAARQGRQATFDALQVQQEPAEPEVADQLKISLGEPLTTVRRIIKVDGEPAAYMYDAVLPSVLLPGDVDATFNGSMLDLLKHKGHPVVRAVADIAAVESNSTLAGPLGVKRGRAILMIKQVSFDQGGKAIEYSRGYFIPEYFRFFVVRH